MLNLKHFNLKILNFLTLVIFSFTLLFFSPFVFAQEPLVPCSGPDCDFCDLMTLTNRIVDFGFKFIILPLAALGILSAGLVLLTAGGSETQLKKGKSMLIAIIVGFFIAVSGWFIINTILGAFVVPGQFYNPLTEPFPACVKIDELEALRAGELH